MGLEQRRERHLDQGKWREDIHVVHGSQLNGRVVGELRLRAGAESAGVVDQQAERSGVDCGVDQCGAVGCVGDVACDGDQPRRVKRDGRGGQFRGAASVHNDGPAAFEKRGSERPAQPARGAGNDCDISGLGLTHTGILTVKVNFKSMGS